MKRKSPEYHKLTGTFEPGRHNKTSLSYPPSDGRPPRWMKDAEAKREWRRIAPLLLAAGNLQMTDETLLGTYCMAVSGYLQCLRQIQTEGWTVTVSAATRTGQSSKPIKNPAVSLMMEHQKTMQSVAARFGFTPYDRSRISGISAPDDGDQPLQPTYTSPPAPAAKGTQAATKATKSRTTFPHSDALGPYIVFPESEAATND